MSHHSRYRLPRTGPRGGPHPPDSDGTPLWLSDPPWILTPPDPPPDVFGVSYHRLRPCLSSCLECGLGSFGKDRVENGLRLVRPLSVTSAGQGGDIDDDPRRERTQEGLRPE